MFVHKSDPSLIHGNTYIYHHSVWRIHTYELIKMSDGLIICIYDGTRKIHINLANIGFIVELPIQMKWKAK